MTLISGDMTTKKPTKEQLIKELVSLVGVDKVNITKFAEGMGVSRQYISKVVNRLPKLQSFGCCG